jgi:SsrA-binding protein
VNRLAYRNYEIVDTIEAGISLVGTEVKSIRDGKMTIRDGYVKPSKNGRSCTLHNVHIGKHSMAGAFFNVGIYCFVLVLVLVTQLTFCFSKKHEEMRVRPLLIHKEQARKFLQQVEQQGMTVIPLKVSIAVVSSPDNQTTTNQTVFPGLL